MSGVALRAATVDDLAALVAIETACFDSDRMSRRALRHAITAPTGATIVAERAGAPAGYGLIVFRQGSSVARITSLAVLPDARGGNIGGRLLAALEEAARQRGCDRVRLEVRIDNAVAIGLYERAGYRRFAVCEDFYEDGATAWRYEKRLA